MSNESPVDVGVLELINANLSGESAIGLVEDILSSNAELLVGELAGEGEVEGRRRDDDLGGGIELSGVEVVNDGLDGLSRAVPGRYVSGIRLPLTKWDDGGASRGNWDWFIHLEVSTDEELARHAGGMCW